MTGRRPTGLTTLPVAMALKQAAVALALARLPMAAVR
jgi:hypothetical protein